MSSDDEGSDEEARRLREVAHARRAHTLAQWSTAAAALTRHGWAVLDSFLGAPAARALRDDVRNLRTTSAAMFAPGRTAAAADDDDRAHSARVLRGDLVARLHADDARMPSLRQCVRQADRLVRSLARGVEELRGVEARSAPMIACYPGGGARYVRHVDNPGGNRRVLTWLLYLNEEWQHGDGGELRLYDADGGVVEVEPLLDRAVVFLSKKVPHEVVATQKERLAVSVWYEEGPGGAADGGGTEHEDDITQFSFGRNADEIKAFLFALADLNPAQSEGIGADSNFRDKDSTFSSAMLRSW
ncbi:hypothetical protein AB1Y20_021206 [Prymnesium parvum]|uniref:Fe2OG dioxygenase domain-containing protein n=1 Tax=Prymnesium parvum TaxID=97485 RepID=A0AB34JJZ8_PRYPA